MKYYIILLIFISVIILNSCGDNESTSLNDFTLVLQPDSLLGKDAHISLLIGDTNRGNTQTIAPYTWTQDGIINISRDLIEFDLSDINPNAIIDSAFLYLFYNGETEITLKEHHGDNYMILQRVIEPWDELSVTWNTQPAIDTLHQLFINKSSTPFDDYILDITILTKDIIAAGINNGFLLRLRDEVPYTVSLFGSSDHPNDSLHPKLIIYYKQ